MNHNVYKLIELTGTSNNTIEEAVQNAITRASGTVRNMRWFEVVETRGAIKDALVTEWQVTIKVGFSLDE